MLLPVEGIETTIAGYLEDTWVAAFANDKHSHLGGKADWPGRRAEVLQTRQ
jgi:hypothetical protein